MNVSVKPRKAAGSEVAPVRQPKKKAYFDMVWASEVKKKPVQWLWNGYLPVGTVSMFTGDPQAGKSTVICDLVASLSRGRPLPGETEERRPINSWIMSSEDNKETIILWRLENQDADLSRILITDKRVSLKGNGLKEMEAIIRTYQIEFVSIDTTTTWMGGDIDMNKGNEIMSWVNGLKEICDRTGCTIILIRHRRKGAPSDNKLYAGMGSIGFTAAVRSELMATVRKDGLRILERSKGNIGAPPPRLAYDIASGPDPENPHGILRWVGDFADDSGPSEKAPKTPSKTPSALKRARDALRDLLSAGPISADMGFARMKELGFSEATAKRARQGLVKAIQVGKGVWEWHLEVKSAKTAIDEDGEEYLICR